MNLGTLLSSVNVLLNDKNGHGYEAARLQSILTEGEGQIDEA